MLENVRSLLERHKTSIRFLALAAVLAVMFFRAPSFFLTPRLWAEEGTFYFANAYYHAQSELWYKGLDFLAAGYYSLWPNVATTVAANCVSLENVPYVTLLFSVAVQLIPFAIVLWSISAFWQSTLRKTAGIFVLLYAPICGQVWLNTILSQVFFAITTFLLLLEDAPVAALRRWIYRILLVLGGFTGPISCFLSTLFLQEAYREKNKERWIQAAIISACAAVQVYLMFFVSPRGGRSVFDLPTYILSLGTQSVGVVLMGFEKARVLAKTFLDAYRQGGDIYATQVIVCFVVLSLILFFLSKGIPAKERRILFGSYLLLTVISFYGALGEDKSYLIRVGTSTRYFYASNIIFLLLILARIRKPFGLGSLVATAMLIVSITYGMLDYKKTLTQNESWPAWSDEVQAWREDSCHKVAIWPSPWAITLEKWGQRPLFTEQLISSSKKDGEKASMMR